MFVAESLNSIGALRSACSGPTATLAPCIYNLLSVVLSGIQAVPGGSDLRQYGLFGAALPLSMVNNISWAGPAI